MPLVPKRWKLHCYLSDVWGGLHGVLPFYGIFDWKRGNCIAITIFVCACLPVSVRVFLGFLYLHVPVCMPWRQAQIINKDLPYMFVCLHFEFLLIWGRLFVLDFVVFVVSVFSLVLPCLALSCLVGYGRLRRQEERRCLNSHPIPWPGPNEETRKKGSWGILKLTSNNEIRTVICLVPLLRSLLSFC